jgi:hypothetical protein
MGVVCDLLQVAADPKEVEGSGACGGAVLPWFERAEDLAMAKVLDKLTNLLAAKTDRWASSATHGDGRQQTPHEEVRYKLELMPNEIKLDGVGNYLSWSRRGMLILRMKSMEGYVLGKVSEYEDKEGQEWKKWNAMDSLVLTWLLNSLTPAVAASVEALSTSTKIRCIQARETVMLVSQIEDTIHDLTQDEKTVLMTCGRAKACMSRYGSPCPP